MDTTKLDPLSKSMAQMFLETYPEWECYFNDEPWPEEDDPLDGEYSLVIRVPSPAPSSDRELVIDLRADFRIIFGIWFAYIDSFVGDSDEDYFNRAKQVIDSIINEEVIFEVNRWGNVSVIKREDVPKIMPGSISHTYSWRGTYDKRY